MPVLGIRSINILNPHKYVSMLFYFIIYLFRIGFKQDFKILILQSQALVSSKYAFSRETIKFNSHVISCFLVLFSEFSHTPELNTSSTVCAAIHFVELYSFVSFSSRSSTTSLQVYFTFFLLQIYPCFLHSHLRLTSNVQINMQKFYLSFLILL